MRRKENYRRQHKPDRIYDRVDFGRFINYLMEKGEKTVAEKNFYQTLEILKSGMKSDPVKTFEKAIENISPLVEVVSKRIGGANYQVPREVRMDRRFFLACGWLIDAARKKKGKPIAQKLAEEIMAASKNEGAAIKKKQDTHRMAEANRAFASFAR